MPRTNYFLPLALLVVVTAVLQLTDLDLQISALFFDESSTQWLGKDRPICVFVYDWGPAFVLVPGILGIAYIVAGMTIEFRSSQRLRSGLCLVLSPTLSHVLINEILKRIVDRPRPRYVIEFSGPRSFQKILDPDFIGEGNSLPSSHAAAGYSRLSLYFLFQYRRRRLAVTFLIAGATAGSIMGFVRVCQGAHFTSDVLWAFGVIYFANLLLYRHWYTRKIDDGKNDPSPLLH